MKAGAVVRWQVAPPSATDEPDTRQVSLAFGEPAPHGIFFHDAVPADLPRADTIDVWPPAYRGRALIGLLAWLAGQRLAAPGAQVRWWLDKRQGPDSIARMLADLGWSELTRQRDGRVVRLAARPPEVAEAPQPDQFTTRLGGRELAFDADYGVFSPKRLDDGTALLAEVALREAPVEVVADIGVGYGALAVGLATNGIAARAVATDIDAVALWLAQRNADRYGVELAVACHPDPTVVPPTRLTVCNVPTHINAAESTALLAGLRARAEYGRLLVVVHTSLAGRYQRHLAAAGLAVEQHPGPAHTVLATGRRSR